MSFWRLVACVAAFTTASALAQTPAASSTTAVPATASTTASPAVAGTAAVPATASTAAAPAVAGSTAAAFDFDYGSLQPGDPAAGQTKSAVCGACHGLDGNPPTSLYPRLAGQSEHFIALQLAHYKSGERVDPVMGTFATPLSGQDMRDIGAWFASQEPTFGVADEALVELGRSLYREGDAARGIPACMACHGPSGLGNPGAPYPQLAGQFADYVAATLKAWRDDGEVWGESDNAQIMPAIAERLSDGDIAALASFIEDLHPAQLAVAGNDSE